MKATLKSKIKIVTKNFAYLTFCTTFACEYRQNEYLRK